MQYAYKAIDPRGRTIHGRMDANNALDLEARLKRMGLDFIDGSPRAPGWRYGTRITRRDLIDFCFHLDQLSRAGVPIIESLIDLRDSLENPRFREVLAGLIESVGAGKLLSQALAEHPQVFDDIFVSLVRAGEDSGKLATVLGNLTASLKWQDELAAQSRKLALYPAFMGTVVLGVVLFALLYLVPRMAGFIGNMGQALPAHTQALIAISSFFTHAWPIALGLPLLACGIGLLAVRTSERARRRLDALKLKLPWIGAILGKIVLARFTSVFAMMYAAGIAIPEALCATQGIVGNRVFREGLQRVAAMIGEGQNITAAFQNTGLFPPLVIRMLRVGEGSGALDTALLNVSYFYDRDVRESIARVLTLSEPLMTLIVGLVLGWTMLAVLGPIYDSIARLKL